MAHDQCTADECANHAFRRGLCHTHYLADREGREVSGRMPKGSGFDLVREAALSYADAGDDETAYRRSEDNLRKAAERYGRRAHCDAIRSGMQQAKALGVHVGRPRALSTSDREISEVAQVLGIRRAALALGISKDAVRRAIARGAKGTLSSQ